MVLDSTMSQVCSLYLCFAHRWSFCVGKAYFYRHLSPFAGHLPVKLPDYNNRLRVLVATYVTFSPDGTELLVNMGGEQVISL